MGTTKAGKAFQEQYPAESSHCYGCGTLNQHGLHIKSYWDGDESVCTFRPKPYHTAIPGYVYGGLIASLIDCHGTGTAYAANCRALGIPLGNPSAPRFVTAALHVDYLRPTPIAALLQLHGVADEIKGRKVVIQIRLEAAGQLCARGQVVAVQAPDSLFSDAPAHIESTPGR